MPADTATLRVLDAAFNRATEGLRVAEDFARFILDDSHLTEALKLLRHDLRSVLAAIPDFERFTSRDVRHDVGAAITTAGETDRQNLLAVFFANIQRARQALRSLEEFSKLLDAPFASQIESLRYRLYTLEKAAAVTHESRVLLDEFSLCVLIDGQNTVEKFSDLAAQLFEAGLGMIQLRDKNLSDRELVDRARILVSIANECRSPDVTTKPAVVIINDRADIAAAAGADGVHLGQDDLRVKDARQVLGPRKLIGVSTHNLDQARQAVLDGANYLGAGPTFASRTKSFDVFPGLDHLRQVAAEIRLPTYAIGGIDAENLGRVLATGINRVAVSGAVVAAAEVGKTVRALLRVMRDSA